MSNASLGTKHRCDECGIKYYDLNRDEVSCPRCGTPPGPPEKPAAPSRGRGRKSRAIDDATEQFVERWKVEGFCVETWRGFDIDERVVMQQEVILAFLREAGIGYSLAPEGTGGGSGPGLGRSRAQNRTEDGMGD